jgi:hypothetical protein
VAAEQLDGVVVAERERRQVEFLDQLFYCRDRLRGREEVALDAAEIDLSLD